MPGKWLRRRLVIAAAVCATVFGSGVVFGPPGRAATTTANAFPLVASSSFGAPTWLNAIAIDPAAQRVYVLGFGALYVMDEATLTEVHEIEVGLYGTALALDPVTSRAFIGYADNGVTAVTVVDTKTDSVIGSIPSGREPTHVAVDESTGLVYIGSGRDGTVTVADGQTLQDVATIPVQSPGQIAVNPQTNQIFVADAGYMDIFDRTTYQLEARVPDGGGGGGFDLDPSTDTVYVSTQVSPDTSSSSTVGEVWTISGTTDQVIQSTPTGAGLGAVQFDPARKWLYLADQSAPSLSLVDPTDGNVVDQQSVPVASAEAYDPVTRRLLVLSGSGSSGGTINLLEYDTSGAVPSSTTLSADVNPDVYGQKVTFTAAVTPSDGSGSIEFLANGSPIPGCQAVPLTSNGSLTTTATCSTAALPAGANTIDAEYTGSSGSSPSNAEMTQQVSPLSTSTTVTATPNPSTFGQNVTFTAEVTGSDGSGSVEFLTGGSPLPGCQAVPVTADSGSGTVKATCSTAALPAGTTTVEANYLGDGDSAPSQGQLSQVVQRAATSTRLGSSSNPSTYGQAVTFTATVSPTDGGGTVQFLDGSTAIPGCGAVGVALSSGGASATATCSTNNLTPETHSIQATWSGDSDYLGSSAALSETVDRAASEIRAQPAILSVGAAPGQAHPMTLAATLTVAGSGQPLSGRSVSMSAGGKEICTAITASDGTASCNAGLGSATVIAAGGYSATFAGDNFYEPSQTTAPLVTQ